ncbi:hypothetical protein L211DRAFT_280002 [Terfezia boudieri ATCC MYA-4762]|uniref:Uncharacterized protein n=1 Tax=Terfezia boudieri ATCC MYA-4762 TaxID=1051890 RepID=A0A3N4LK64_9PEZI|nr:hypothetical protein L211DRAFT_280002 [Terfezia boudieri ATCC MYA-4762]
MLPPCQKQHRLKKCLLQNQPPKPPALIRHPLLRHLRQSQPLLRALVSPPPFPSATHQPPPPPQPPAQLKPGTPTSLRAGVAGPQIAQQWNPAEGYHGEAYRVEGGYPAQQGYDQNYPANFPFPEETYDAGYHGTGQAYSPSAGTYHAYSPPSTPWYPPGTAHSPH